MRHILLFVILAAVFYGDVYGIYPARVGKRSPPSDEDIDCSFGLCKFNGKLDGNVGNRGHGPGRLGLKNQNQYAHDPSLSPRQLSYEEFMAYPGKFNQNGHIKSPTSHFPHPTNGLGRRGPKFAAAEGSQPRECQVGEPCFEDPYNPVHRRFNSRRFGSNNNDEDEFGPRSRLPEPFPYGLKRRNNNENRLHLQPLPAKLPHRDFLFSAYELVCKCDDSNVCWRESLSHRKNEYFDFGLSNVKANRSSKNPLRTYLNSCAYDWGDGGIYSPYERLVAAMKPGVEHYKAVKDFSHQLLEHSLEHFAVKYGVVKSPQSEKELEKRKIDFLYKKGRQLLEAHAVENVHHNLLLSTIDFEKEI